MIIKTVYQEKAPAKINLYLDVLDRKFYPREDGFHNIKTLFQAIDLADQLNVEIESLVVKSEKISYEIIIKSNVPEIDTLGENNIVHKSLMLYFSALDSRILEQIQRIKINIYIDKKIPISAGLAGGSADAAAILRVINRYFYENFNGALSSNTLIQLATKIGADVPFCLNSLLQPRAYAEGIGEDFKDKKSNINYNAISNLIMVKPDFGIATSEAYRAVDKFVEKKRLKKITGLVFNRERSLTPVQRSDVIEDLYNSFEEAIADDYPLLTQIKGTLYSKFGANKVLLAGSGSTMLAFYPKDIGNLNQIFAKVKETYESKNYSVFKSKFLDPMLN
ncbi:MAG: 4-(cytidine 5'-diphospho)-2-C-methyl-D-erythritol kinase [bacterium]